MYFGTVPQSERVQIDLPFQNRPSLTLRSPGGVESREIEASMERARTGVTLIGERTLHHWADSGRPDVCVAAPGPALRPSPHRLTN